MRTKEEIMRASRPIRFRAWNPVQKTMYLIGSAYSFVNGVLTETATDNEDGEIVMQYTGLKDKNGKEIYEGDILRSRENDEVWCVDNFIPLHRHDYVTNIGYFSGKKYHLRVNPAGRYSQSDNLNDWLSWPEMYEIIGNIYEHPELLK